MKNEDIKDMNNGKRFDICLMNPPYARRLHLKFLEKVIEISDNIISIQPINWLNTIQDRRNKKSSYYKYQNSISNHIKNLEILSEQEAKKYFNNIQSTQLGIYSCDKKGGYDYENKLSNPVVENIIDYINQNTVELNNNEYKGWRVRIPKAMALSGSGDRPPYLTGLCNLRYFYNGEKNGKPWYDYYMKNQNSKFTKEIPVSIKFYTEEEANNFCRSLETDFGKYIENLLITDMRIIPNRILWLGNAKHPRTGKIGYKSEWTNKDFYKFFNINTEWQKNIENFISNNENDIDDWFKSHNKIRKK